jgi:hypothetical protein
MTFVTCIVSDQAKVYEPEWPQFRSRNQAFANWETVHWPCETESPKDSEFPIGAMWDDMT